MKLKNALLVPVVAGLLIYGGIKGFIYYKVKSGLDQMVTMAEPFAAISYGGIASGLEDGSITVEKISITPGGSSDAVQIDAINVRGDGLVFLLDLVNGFSMDKPPEQLQISVRQAEFPLNADILGQFEPEGSRDKAESCTIGGLFQYADLEHLGYETLIANISMSYRLDPRTGEMDVHSDYSLNTIESSSMEFFFKRVPQPGAMMMGATPVIDRFSIRYQLERGYLNGVIDYCAKQSGQTADSFIAGLFDKDDSYYLKNLGYLPGPGLRFALKQFIAEEPGEILITGNPGTDLDPSTLSAYKPADIVTLLGLELSVNNQLVTDLSFTLPETGGEGVISRIRESQVDSKPDMSTGMQRNRKLVKQKKLRFIETELGQLKSYIGRNVKLYTSLLEKPKEGILVSLKDRQVHLEQRIYGGKMTTYVAFDDIKKAAVLRREK